MSGPRRAVVVAMLALAAAGSVAAKPRKPAPKPPPAAAAPVAPHAEVATLADGTRADLVFDGALLGWAAPREAGGVRSLYLLIAAPAPPAAAPACSVAPVDPKGEASGPARLFRWRAAHPAEVELIRSDLPSDGSLDAADLDGDGLDELLLIRPGAIEALSVGGADGPATRTLIEDAEIARPFGDPVLVTPAAGDLPIRAAVVGAFRSWRRTQSGTLVLASDVDLPVVVDPGRTRDRVASPEVVVIGRGREGRMLFATAPEAVGLDRVRTFLLDPDAPLESRSSECWGQFPERERLLDSGVALLDGNPVLIATSTAADKLSVFSGKNLRVFPLGPDRTRVGGAPSFAGETDINLWQRATPFVLDLDRDGRDDLVLGYWKGLTHDLVALEVHRRNPDGTFAKARTEEFQVDDAETEFLDFGRDLDGDGRPDLAILSGGALRVYAGADPERAVAKPVAEKPSRSIPLAPGTPGAHGPWMEFRLSSSSLVTGKSAPGLGDPRFVDLDGDGRDEILFVGSTISGSAASIVRIRGAEVAPAAGISYK
jgi:hypothetical protein